MPSMKLDNGSFLGRNLRRLGRFGVAVLSLGAAAAAFGAAYLITDALGLWMPRLCTVAGLAAGLGTYVILGRLDLIPDDPDKPISLNLTERSNDARAQPRVSSDHDPH
jgi:hypothetical protein